MKIGVLSDTHIPYAAAALPQRVFDLLAPMDAVIHAGDYQDLSVVDALESLGNFYGVCGNMDPPAIRRRLPEQRVVLLNGYCIGITHGRGSPADLEALVAATFENRAVDAIVYGHSHAAACVRKDHVLFFNPGSPTDTRFAARNSIGVLTLEDTIAGEIIPI